MDNGLNVQQRRCKVEGCGRESRAQEYCTKHYQLFQKYGVPCRVVKPMRLLKDKEGLKTALLSRRLVAENGCWLWQGSRGWAGYGRIGVENKVLTVSRVSAYAWLGFDISSPLHVLHHCDIPPCFNPEHLFIGTRSDNMRDAATKQRTCGEKSSNAKLTTEQVIAIKKRLANGDTTASLADVFMVSRAAIRAIKNGINWKHIEI